MPFKRYYAAECDFCGVPSFVVDAALKPSTAAWRLIREEGWKRRWSRTQLRQIYSCPACHKHAGKGDPETIAPAPAPHKVDLREVGHSCKWCKRSLKPPNNDYPWWQDDDIYLPRFCEDNPNSLYHEPQITNSGKVTAA